MKKSRAKRMLLHGFIAVMMLFSSLMPNLSQPAQAIDDCDKIAIEKGSLFTDNDKCKSRVCSPNTNAATVNGPGSVFILGDSIGGGVASPLTSKLPENEGWGVASDTRVGRPLSEGIKISESKPPAIAAAKYIVVILGTNNVDSASNQADIQTLVTNLKNQSPSAAIYWLTLNVTKPELTAGAVTFNRALATTSGITLIQNTAPISSDGIHPSDYGALAETISTTIRSGGSSAGNQNPVAVGSCICSAGGSTQLTGSDNAEKIWNFFTGKGLSAVQVAGIMGNLQQESSLDPEKLQGGKRSQNPADAGSGGFGLMQWTPGSKIVGLLSQAGITSPVYELGTQLDLVWWHMNNTSPTGVKNFIAGFLQKTSIEEATSDFEERMEGAGKPMMERRIQYAKDFYALYANSSPLSSPEVGVSSGDCSDITGAGQETRYTSDGFMIYSQTDPAWKDTAYSSSTIGKSGCGPAAMAMIITALTGKKVTPVETAAYAAEKGLYVEGAGSSWNIGPVLAEHWGLKAVNIGVDAAKIEATLRVGGLVITAGQGAKPFTDGGHFLVIRGITAEGKYKVGDSGHSDTSDREWDVDQILASMNGRDGSVYAITK